MNLRSLTKLQVTLALVSWLTWGAFMLDKQLFGLFASHWPMTLTMALGSFVAGATSEGGGAVAFPVMTLCFNIAPAVARDFSLAIQSVGMTCASIAMFASRTPIIPSALRWAGLGGALGVILGMEHVAPLLSGPRIKIFFVSAWASFGCALYLINKDRSRALHSSLDLARRPAARGILLGTGIVGGIVSGITGSGLDILTFAVLTLSFRVDERVATPTSVVLMASNACVAVLYRSTLGSPIMPEALSHFWVCVPVVVVGAPLGARVIQTKSRQWISGLLYTSIGLQYLGAVVLVIHSLADLWWSAQVFMGGLVLFLCAGRWGKRA